MIDFNGVMLDRAGVLAALNERAVLIAGELDRVRIDCDLPYLADTLSLSAGELHEHAVTVLDNGAGGANVVPRLLSAFDALILVVAMVESSNMADEGFPRNAQGRAPLRLLRPAFGDDAHPGDGGAQVSRVGAGVPAASSWCAWPTATGAASTVTGGPADTSWSAWPTAARAASTATGA